MDKLLEALAELLGVGTKTLERVVDTTGLVLPDLVEKAMRELPLFRLLSYFDTVFILLFVLFLSSSILFLFLNADSYYFEDKGINKVNKNLFILTVLFLLARFSTEVLKATLTPTIYSLEHVVEKMK